MAHDFAAAPPPRAPRPLLSRVIDRVTSALGNEWAFIVAVVVVITWLVGLLHFSYQDQNYQFLINTGSSIVTFVMVFAVQHTANRDAQALHIKLDELLRASDARSELIGVENETAQQLAERKAELEAARHEDADR